VFRLQLVSDQSKLSRVSVAGRVQTVDQLGEIMSRSVPVDCSLDANLFSKTVFLLVLCKLYRKYGFLVQLYLSADYVLYID